MTTADPEARRGSRVELPRALAALLREGPTLFAVSHSGGKDSQAMMLAVASLGLPDTDIAVFHADLGEAEWPGVKTHIRRTAAAWPLVRCTPFKTFFEMVEHRGRFPSPSVRQCTSDLKRGPIEREVRRYLKRNPRFGGRVVTCMGMRAEESPARARRIVLRRSARNSRAGREWWEWLPIHGWSEDRVWDTIAAAGQTPHPAYLMGMSRLSCRFCIMASAADLTVSARANPRLYARYCEMETRLGHTLSPSRKTLPDITGVDPLRALASASA